MRACMCACMRVVDGHATFVMQYDMADRSISRYSYLSEFHAAFGDEIFTNNRRCINRLCLYDSYHLTMQPVPLATGSSFKPGTQPAASNLLSCNRSRPQPLRSRRVSGRTDELLNCCRAGLKGAVISQAESDASPSGQLT